MAKLFRRIRHKLFKEGRFRKYMIYAFGEIFLVVVGILLALQINDWNEDRKSILKTEDLFVRVHKELARNVSNTCETINRYRSEQLEIYQIVNKKLTAQDYQTDPALAYIIYGAFPADIDDQAFNNLIDYKGEYSKEQDEIIVKLNKLYKDDQGLVDILNEQILINFFKYQEKLKDTQPWYGDYILYHRLTDEMIDYFINDPFYFNQVVSHLEINYREHLSATIAFYTEAFKIYHEVSDILDLPKDTSIVKDLSSFDHYVGIYKSSNDEQVIHEIQKEEDHFLFNTKKNNLDSTLITSFRFYPDKKSTVILKEGFGEFLFDDNDEVTALIYLKGARRLELKKVQ